MDDVGLGAAMGQYAVEAKAERALDECARLSERVLLLEKTLTTVLNVLVAHGITIASSKSAQA